MLHALKPFWNYEVLELTLIISLHVMFTLDMVEVTFAWMMTLCILMCIKYWGITFACGFSTPIKTRSRLQLRVGSLSLQLLAQSYELIVNLRVGSLSLQLLAQSYELIVNLCVSDICSLLVLQSISNHYSK
jgi:hypothetical protein